MNERLMVKGIRKAYGPRLVLRELSFSVADGEVFALLGPSGCGKTTLLNLIAGLDRPDAGEIEVGGRPACGAGIWLPPQRRGVGMVFQDQMLWPHMSVSAHLDFVLRAQGLERSERVRRIAEQLESVRLTGRDGARPGELSGGERQRLSIARALVARPSLLLLDEPCAHLDAPLKVEILELLGRLRAERNFAAVYVTHDATEAFRLASRAAVLEEGVLVQMGTPSELRERPATQAVARIIDPWGPVGSTT